MVDSKRKGSDFEREAVKELNKSIEGGSFKRIPGSGAMGTILDEPFLQGDILGKLEFLSKNIKIDSKVGYGGAKQLTLKRKWLEKIREEAERDYSIPMLICKFSGSRKTKYFVALDFEAFVEIINKANKLKKIVDKMNDH